MKAAGDCDICRLTDWMFCECAEGTGRDNTPDDLLARSVLIHLHTDSPFTYWVRKDGEKWKWVEVESPEHVWELVGEGELLVSPVPWPLRGQLDRLIQVFASDTGPGGFEDVARLSFLPMSVVPE